MSDGKLRIDITAEEYRRWLERQWSKHVELNKIHHEEDTRLLAHIRKIEENTVKREGQVLNIHAQLEQHLDALTLFIEAIAV